MAAWLCYSWWRWWSDTLWVTLASTWLIVMLPSSKCCFVVFPTIISEKTSIYVFCYARSCERWGKSWCVKLWSEGVGCQVYPGGDWKGNREGNIWYISPPEHLYLQIEDSKSAQIWSHEAYGGKWVIAGFLSTCSYCASFYKNMYSSFA